jgi:hypothetical protein
MSTQALTSRTREGDHLLPSVNLSIPRPVISVCGPRSSQAYTQPERSARRSSASSRRVTIWRVPRRMAVKIRWASFVDRMRTFVHVGCCIALVGLGRGRTETESVGEEKKGQREKRPSQAK